MLGPSRKEGTQHPRRKSDVEWHCRLDRGPHKLTVMRIARYIVAASAALLLASCSADDGTVAQFDLDAQDQAEQFLKSVSDEPTNLASASLALSAGDKDIEDLDEEGPGVSIQFQDPVNVQAVEVLCAGKGRAVLGVFAETDGAWTIISTTEHECAYGGEAQTIELVRQGVDSIGVNGALIKGDGGVLAVAVKGTQEA